MRSLTLAAIAVLIAAGMAAAQETTSTLFESTGASVETPAVAQEAQAVSPESTGAGPEAIPAAESAMAAFFPRPQEISGWATTADVRMFAGKKIFDFIDGAGEVYMTYNFEVVAAAEYAEPGGGAISLEIYRMKTPEDAYGIYSYNRGSKYDALDVKQAGYVSGVTGGAWKDVYYVKAYGLDDKPGVAGGIKDFVTLVSQKIPGEGRLPDIFRTLDVEGLKKGSERFLRAPLALKNLHFVSDDNVLNLGEDTQLVMGDYLLKNRDFTAFVVLYPTADAAVAAASKYSSFLGAHPEAEATWLKQIGKAICGTWTGLKGTETKDSQDMLFSTIQSLVSRAAIYGFNK